MSLPPRHSARRAAAGLLVRCMQDPLTQKLRMYIVTRAAWVSYVHTADAHTTCRLLTDEGFRQQLLSSIARTGHAVEEALGSAQDVEGCVEADGTVTVVQTRPQM